MFVSGSSTFVVDAPEREAAMRLKIQAFVGGSWNADMPPRVKHQRSIVG